ncbi:hypothetical protein DSL72_003376 [Monilinia vaccinii-corymbosi]|uniref:Nephrocystin 3-like N-terminal domain-containing protein n=1 Tax=Monilinia vaccinii-corymbosi TaxID=61207 RepID=A0A8A3P252_9HELO|nr:hypothetical protein DSL72_003376 [Monilinia vaccinii-corymbosi]
MVYFYCISPTTSNDVVRSLVSQLAWTLNGKEIESSIIDMFNDAQPPQSTEPTPEDWLKALLKLCQRVNKVKMVIDALDECRDFGRLLKTLERLKIERGNCVRFLFSSRLNVNVNKVFPESDGVILTVEDTSEDISRYIADEVRSKEEDIECNVEAAKKELINRINLALISFAGGMFKWVALQLAVMFPMDEQTFYPENIQVQLQNIENRTLNKEQSLNNAYGAVYTLNNKPGPYNSRVSMGLYKWLLCCKKALPTEEVVKIIELSLDNDPDFEKLTRNPLSTKVVLHCCSNFVIRSADDTFRFAHLSVEEYLVNYCGVKVEFQPEQCHFFVMKMCLALISTRITRPVSKQKQELVSNLQQRPKGSKEAEMLPQKRASPVERIHDSSFLKYSISYWAYHSRRVPFEIRSNEILYKSFVLGPKLSLSLQWWYSRIKARKFEETIDSQYPRNNAMFLSELPVPDQNLLESCLLMLGAVFDLPEVISNGLRGCGEGIDRQIFARRTPLLVAIYYGSPKSVQYLLDHGANPCLKSSGHGGGTDEGMVFWVTRQGSSHQTKVEERLKVEEILLNNKHSRQAFLNQLERSLMIHPEPLRAMKVLHQAEIETPVFANIIEKQIKTEGLGKLIDFLDCMNDENFDDEMVLGVIHFDSSKTVKRVFEFKRIEKVTELMVQNALKSDDPETFAYFMTEFDPGVSIQKLVIDEKLRRPEIWKIILAVKGSHFVN